MTSSNQPSILLPHIKSNMGTSFQLSQFVMSSVPQSDRYENIADTEYAGDQVRVKYRS